MKIHKGFTILEVMIALMVFFILAGFAVLIVRKLRHASELMRVVTVLRDCNRAEVFYQQSAAGQGVSYSVLALPPCNESLPNGLTLIYQPVLDPSETSYGFTLYQTSVVAQDGKVFAQSNQTGAVYIPEYACTIQGHAPIVCPE